MTAPIGHNQPTIDLPEGFEVDYGHVLMDRVFYHPDLKDMIKGDRLLLAFMGFGMKRGCAKVRISLSFANTMLKESSSTTEERFKRLRALGWIKWIPGRGSRPTEWELDLPPTDLEVAIRNAVEAYNAKVNSSVPTYRGTTISSPPTHRETKCVSPPMERETKQRRSLSAPMERETSCTGSDSSLPIESPHPPDGPGTTNTNTASKQADSPKKEAPLVAPLSAVAEWMRQKLEPFGSSGMKWAQRLKGFLDCDLEEAVGEMDMLSDNHGPLNVVEAIQDVLDVTDIRTTPKNVLRGYVTANTTKHGRRLMPKPAEESPVRRLSMAERSFRC